MECHEAIDRLTATAGNPEGPDPTALAHVLGCAACLARSGFLLRGLRSGAEDRLTCGQAEDLLPEYLLALDTGQGSSPAWEDLGLHLAACSHCAAALADLRELVALADSGAMPPTYPAMRPSAPPGRPRWRLDDLGRLVVELLGGLGPLAPAAHGLKKQGGSMVLGELVLADAAPDLSLRVALLGDPAERRRSLVVTIEIPSRGGWPNLAGSEVLLLRGGKQIAMQRTDAFGVAVFSGLGADEVAQLAVAVRPG